ncbi:MAG: VOC family protein [Sphingomonas sp.]|nr:VOC family protein [Sphingomonas sp.]
MKLGYTILFVPDVAAAVTFYEKAFGLQRTSLNPAFATLDTGATTLAFGSEANERRELGAQEFRANRTDDIPGGFQISFVADDVAIAFDRAIAAGASAVCPPKVMPWGQTVSRVRDLNGALVSIVTAPRF